jgi:hypothetical protein
MNVNKYYFAARYSRNSEMCGYRDELLAAIPGAVVTSRWIDCHNGEVENSLGPDSLAADPQGCWKYGAIDIEDLIAADVIVSFTGDGGGGKGGRHIEHGFAMASTHRLVIVGPRENIFHCDPNVTIFDSWGQFLEREMAPWPLQ